MTRNITVMEELLMWLNRDAPNWTRAIKNATDADGVIDFGELWRLGETTDPENIGDDLAPYLNICDPQFCIVGEKFDWTSGYNVKFKRIGYLLALAVHDRSTDKFIQALELLRKEVSN